MIQQDESLRSGDSKHHHRCTVLVHELPRCLLPEPADGPSLGLSPPQLSTVTLEDLELLLTEGLASHEPSSTESLEKYECSGLVSNSLVPEQDTPKQWKQLEQW